ncbi:MAG: NAD(P)-dependent oxidoreductase [Balneolaceae bacterium]
MSTVLVSGATGFLGSHIVKALISDNHKVVILKRSTSDTYRINDVMDRLLCYDVDVQNLEEAFSDHKPEVVIHTACSYGKDEEPIYKTVESNLIFGLEILDAAIKYGTGTFFNTGTFYNNASPQKHLNVYTLSKKQFLDWLKQQSDHIQVINMKLEHMYGPTDAHSKFVPWLISRLFEEPNEIPLTKGEQTRDFIYVDDVVSAFMTVLNQADDLSNFEEYIVGTGNQVPLKKFIQTAKRIYEAEIKSSGTTLKFGAVPYRHGEIMKRNSDNQKLTDLGWKPAYTLENGLKKYIISYTKDLKGELN